MPTAARAGLLAALLVIAPPATAAELGAALDSDGLCPRVAWIAVFKEAHSLLAWCDGGGRIEMPVALGRSPRGTKRLRGDDRTPEGVYHIAGEARASGFHLFLPLDYPSRADAAEALAEGRVSEAAYRRILEAHLRGELPPQDTPLGGHLGLHGQGPRWRDTSYRLNWTHGCIALRDGEIELLAERVAPGTPVYIYR